MCLCPWPCPPITAAWSLQGKKLSPPESPLTGSTGGTKRVLGRRGGAFSGRCLSALLAPPAPPPDHPACYTSRLLLLWYLGGGKQQTCCCCVSSRSTRVVRCSQPGAPTALSKESKWSGTEKKRSSNAQERNAGKCLKLPFGRNCTAGRECIALIGGGGFSQPGEDQHGCIDAWTLEHLRLLQLFIFSLSSSHLYMAREACGGSFYTATTALKTLQKNKWFG